ncbi:hypothetical protein Tco_1577462 [Tanacetum coccineum]
MVAESTVPKLVDKKGWEMEPYYIKCIKDAPFQPKNVECVIKLEIQWTLDERRVVVQDQRLKSIIMSCLPDGIIESVISCKTAEATWTNLVHSFEGPSDTKENRIIDLKLYLPEKWLTFSRGLRNANNTLTLDLAYIYERFVFEDNLIKRSNVIHDFQENFDDEVDEKTSEEYLRDLDIDQLEPKIQKDYKTKYKKMKGKLALLEASPSTSQNPKTSQSKNKGLVVKTFDWGEEEVSNDE